MKLEGVTDKIFYIGPTKYAMQEHMYKIYVEVQDLVPSSSLKKRSVCL